MEVNYNYYKIDIADIWQYERLLFLKNNISTDLAEKIIDKTEATIIKKGESNFGSNYKDSQAENDRTYYQRNQEQYVEASNSLRGRFEIDFFFNKYSCFQYDQTIIIDRGNVDFDFWFVLKLRQYLVKISELKSFLSFQLETNFNTEVDEFVNFLKLCIRQYQSALLDKIVVDTVGEWIESIPKLNSDIQQKELSYDIDNKDKLILRINYDSTELFDSVKAFFDEKDFEKLTSLFHEEEIDGKICFKSNANQLIMIFRQLHLNQKIIGSLVNTEKWICKYFTYYGNSKKLSNFNAGNVHKLLTRREYDIPKSKRITLPGLKYIRDKSK